MFLSAFCSALSVVALGLIGVLGASLLHIRGTAPFVAAGGICASAVCVVASVALSLFSAWTRGPMVVLLVSVALATTSIWIMAGRPRPVIPSSLGGVRNWGIPVRLVIGITGPTLILQAYLGARLAPSNWDSMTYHLSRAAYWLQYQSIAQFPGASIRQAASAPNGEVLQGLTMMMSGSDMWTELVQWLALVGLMLIIVSGARLLHFTRQQSVFAACVFALLPQPVMQSTTTQNDLIEAFFVAAVAFFVVRALRDRSAGDMAVAAMSLGLAVGTKGTAFIAGTALLILVAAAVVAYRPPLRFVLLSAVGAIVALSALASYNYVQNKANEGSYLGGVQSQTKLTGDRLPNLLLAFSTFADSPGVNIDWLNRLTSSTSLAVGRHLAPSVGAFAVDTSVQEDTSAYGLVGFLLLPVVLVVAIAGPKQPQARRTLAIAVLVYLVVFGVSLASNPWLGRILIPAVALAAPLFALLARRPAVAGATLVLVILSGAPAVLVNQQKTLLVSGPNVLRLDSRSQMTMIRPEMHGVLDALDSKIARTAPIVIVAGEDSWDYPFFGSRRERRVVRHDRPAEVTYAMLRRDGVKGAVFANVGAPPATLAAEPLGPDYWWVPVPG